MLFGITLVSHRMCPVPIDWLRSRRSFGVDGVTVKSQWHRQHRSGLQRQTEHQKDDEESAHCTVL